ncbi:MAG TPA: hypothetical protein VGD78_19675 [Chthoniobacterales bacterium]
MKPLLLYCRFKLLRPGPTGTPEPLGGFVLGVPQKDWDDFCREHPSADAGGLFQSMILPQEWSLIGRYLRVSLEPRPVVQSTVCGEETDEAGTQATFEGVAGKKFWVTRKPRSPGR